MSEGELIGLKEKISSDDVLQGEGGGSWVTRSERKRGLGEGKTQQCCGNRHYTSCTSRLH